MIYINLDLSDVLDLRRDIEGTLNGVLQQAVADLRDQTHAHILENVQDKLHSSRQTYVDALKTEDPATNVRLIVLEPSADWIEEGQEEHEMIDDLLSGKGAKTANDGSRYAIIPFKHNKGPTQQTTADKDLTDTIKKELKRRQIPYAKIEKDTTGQPKIGLLHKLDIMKIPLKVGEGPGMGHGPVGAVRQGLTGVPFLRGIRVYQKEQVNQRGDKSVVKDIMTFRTVSSKHKGTGRWVHPGTQAKRFFDEAAAWAEEQLHTKIIPDILNRVGESL